MGKVVRTDVCARPGLQGKLLEGLVWNRVWKNREGACGRVEKAL